MGPGAGTLASLAAGAAPGPATRLPAGLLSVQQAGLPERDAEGSAGQLQLLNMAAAHGMMQAGVNQQHLQATLHRASGHNTRAYGHQLGAEVTRHLRAASVRNIIERGLLTASVARDLPCGLLRQVRGGVTVVVAMASERARGGYAWPRRYLGRLCLFVEQDEFNTGRCAESVTTR